MADLRNPGTGRPKLAATHVILCLVFVVLGAVFIGIGIFSGEGRIDLSGVQHVEIHVVATGEVIPFTEEEVAEFLDLFGKKATYKMKDTDEPFTNYTITLEMEDTTLFVSKDRITMEQKGEHFNFRVLNDEWVGLKAILQNHDVAL